MKTIPILSVVFPIFLAAIPGYSFTLDYQYPLRPWDTQKLTFHLNPANCGVSQTNMESAVDTAIAMWNAVPTSKITLVHGSDGTDTPASTKAYSGAADPFILCDSNFSADYMNGNFVTGEGGPQNFDPSSGAFIYGGVALNGEVATAGYIRNLTQTQLAVAIAHEIGHVLGLGHSSDPAAIMSYSHNATSATLGQDDVDGVTYLYPRQESSGLGAPFGCSTIQGITRNGPKNGTGGAAEFATLAVAFFLIIRILKIKKLA